MTTPASTFAQEPLPAYRDYPQPEMIERARSFHAGIVRRRTVRNFDTRPVPREAGSAFATPTNARSIA